MDKNIKKVHFVGIEGTGMSAAARILAESNIRVTGSDLNPGANCKALQDKRVYISKGHYAYNISKDIDLVVISAAIPESNPEVQEARCKNIPVIKYSNLLGSLMEDKKGITIAGTHGKSTTSSMIATMLYEAGVSPSFIIGAVLKNFRSNSYKGTGNYFVAEACEYDRSFLNLHPYIGIITNIEPEHLDYYGTFENVVAAFCDYAKLIPSDGCLIISEKARKYLPSKMQCSVETYGLNEEAEWQAINIKRIKVNYNYSISNNYSFTVLHNGQEIGDFQVPLYGMHNIENALAAIITGYRLGLKKEKIENGLKKFKGIERRFDNLTPNSLATIISDYAHHPTEIRATIKAWAELGNFKPKYLIFQPHQASRTLLLFDEIIDALCEADADEFIICDIFFARDSAEDKAKIHAKDLVEALKKKGKNALYLGDFYKILDYLRRKIKYNTSVLVMGAGNVIEVAEKLREHVEMLKNSF